MSDKDGKLSKSEKQQVVDLLNKHTTDQGPVCAVCSTNGWIIGDHIVAPPVLGDKTVLFGGVLYPNVMLICRTCANTLYFNAVLMGIEEPSETSEETEEVENGQKRKTGG